VGVVSQKVRQRKPINRREIYISLFIRSGRRHPVNQVHESSSLITGSYRIDSSEMLNCKKVVMGETAGDGQKSFDCDPISIDRTAAVDPEETQS
jgi:hypothetical protein